MIRYYGLYARHRVIDDKLHRVIPKSKHSFLLSFNMALLLSVLYGI